METSNMKPNEPSRTTLIIARQRAAHQVLDHGSILYDPFAMKILREDEKDVRQFANEHPLASIGRLFTTARSRIAEDALSGAVERGISKTSISRKSRPGSAAPFKGSRPDRLVFMLSTLSTSRPLRSSSHPHSLFTRR